MAGMMVRLCRTRPWLHCSDQAPRSGLIYYDPDYNSTHNYDLKLTKRYSVLKHFTKGVPVGAIRRAVTPDSDTTDDAWRVLAFSYNDSCGQYGTCDQVPYSIIAMNAQWDASSTTLTGDGTLNLTQPVSMYRTSVTEDYEEVEAPVLSANGSLILDAPEMSIFTIFFS